MSDPPYAATNMDVSSAVTLLLVMPNSSAICPLAGAIMDEDTGLMNVNADTIAVAAHFLCLLQLKNGSNVNQARIYAPTQTHRQTTISLILLPCPPRER